MDSLEICAEAICQIIPVFPSLQRKKPENLNLQDFRDD